MNDRLIKIQTLIKAYRKENVAPQCFIVLFFDVFLINLFKERVTMQDNTVNPSAAPAGGARPIPLGKIRSPGIVLLLSIVTLGIYGIIWMYSILEEMKNYRSQGWSGGLYLIFAILFPPPNLALPWLVPSYVGQMYIADGANPPPITGLSGFWVFLPLAGPIVWIFVVQGNLNRFWQSKGVQ